MSHDRHAEWYGYFQDAMAYYDLWYNGWPVELVCGYYPNECTVPGGAVWNIYYTAEAESYVYDVYTYYDDR